MQLTSEERELVAAVIHPDEPARDYFPGDEFTYSGKTYKILPTWSGYSQRVGIAIPKE